MTNEFWSDNITKCAILCLIQTCKLKTYFNSIITSGSTLDSSFNSSGDNAPIRSSISSRVTLTGAT